MQLGLNEQGVGSTLTSQVAHIDHLFQVRSWVAENVKECRGDCDKDSWLTFKSTVTGKPIRVKCPLLNQDCNCGKGLLVRMSKCAVDNIPPSIPPRYRDLASTKATQATNGVESWDGTGTLYICGNTGTGKSHAAAYWVYLRISKKLSQVWDQPGFWREAAAYNLTWMTAFTVCLDRLNLYAAIDAPMLVVDDLGCEVNTPTNKAVMNEVIAQRYSNKLGTIITSNLSPEEMSGRYLDRMYERIIQHGKMVDAGQINYRLQKY